MIHLNSEQVADILSDQSRITGYFDFKGIATDSREVEPGNLFATWQGENLDGHEFCGQAVEKGAAALLVTHEVDIDIPQIIVPDPQYTLGQLTGMWRQTFDIPVIGVTGSNGKTTIKNMLRTICQYHFGVNHVVAPLKSYNNQVGVPLTLAQIDNNTRIAVVEMGTNQYGDIRYLTNLALPTVTLINNAGRSHLAALGSVEGVAQAKAEIMEGLSDNGIAVLNRDDPFFDYWYSQLGSQQRCLSFGVDDSQADIFLESCHVTTTGSSFRARTPQGDLNVSLQLLGRHNLANALAATACALAAGLNLEAIKEGLQNVEPEKGRFSLYHLPQNTELVDDSYNANLQSLARALDMIMLFTNNRTIVVLGDMLDLGEQTEHNHHDAGEMMYYKGVDYLITYGEASRLAQQKYQSYGLSGKHFSDRNALCYHIEEIVKPGDMILFKASNGMQLGAIAETMKQRLTDKLSTTTQPANET